VERYAARISGPLRDRIDIWVQMPRVEPDEYVRSAAPEGTERVAARVARCRLRQMERSGRANSRLSGRALRAACALGPAEQSHAVRLAVLEGWSARGIERLLRVARTAADLAGAQTVDGSHLDEAARFRSPSGRRLGFEAVS
jgi:magnesium chelatase family protein